MHVSEIEKYIDKYIQRTRNLDENNRVNISNEAEKQSMNENDTSQSVIKDSAKIFGNLMQNPLSQSSSKKSIEKTNTSKSKPEYCTGT